MLDQKSPKPLYTQLAEHFRGMIETGELKPGDQFPAELDLVQRYGVARITVRHAIADLVSEGLLMRRQGKGTFVAAPKIERALVNVSSFSARLQAAGLQPSAKMLRCEVIPAPERLAKELRIEPEAPVVVFTRLRYSNGEPLALEFSHLSLDRCPGLDEVDLNTQSLYRTLEDRYGLRPTHSRKTLELALARPEEAVALDITSGSPLFLLRATVLGDSDPIEYVKTLMRGDRIRFQI
ncbi:MAG: GntR family transcriptional regulator [Bacillota bacterium]